MADKIYLGRPRVVAAVSGGYGVNGAATLLAALTDANINTYGYSTEANGFIHTNLLSPSLPAGSVFKSVTAAFLVRSVPGVVAPGDPPSQGVAKVDLVWLPDFSLLAESPFATIVPNSNLWLETNGAFERPGGGPFTADDVLNRLQARVWTYSTSGARLEVWENYYRIWYNSPPTATPSSPGAGATITTTARPTLAHTYTDNDGDFQEAVRYIVLSGTTPVANPDNLTSAERARLVADSGDMFTSATSWRVVPLTNESALANGSYIWYVKARDTGSRNWGAWASRTFTISVTSPPTPAITRVDAFSFVVSVSLNEGAGSPVATQFEARRTLDGTNWQLLRPSLRVARTGSTAVIADLDAPRNALLRYQVRALGEVSAGEPRPPSAWSASSALVSNPTDGSTRLKSADGLQLTVNQLKVGAGMGLSRSEDMAALYLATQDEPRIVSGRLRSPTLALTFGFLNDLAWNDFLTLYRKRQACLLQTCYGDATALAGQLQMWVRLGPTLEETIFTTDAADMATNQRREVTVGAWVVKEPA